MQGHGYIDNIDDETGQFRNGTLEWMVQTFPSKYGKLKNDTSEGGGNPKWTQREDVWIAYNRQNPRNSIRPKINQQGKLTAGYGGDPGQENHQMGPELGLGWTLGDALEERVLLLKIAWGGKSLAVDFRPPSSGETTGLYYEAMMATTFRTLTLLPKLFPEYDSSSGYELAGFFWHQGWNDGCNVDMAKEYEFNLANLIRDVRTDLGVPHLPVSIGVSGMSGFKPNPRRDEIIAAQFSVANATLYPEFAGTVASVETRGFRRPPRPASPGKEFYHWNNNCESYWLVGKAMGDAMLELINTTVGPIRE